MIKTLPAQVNTDSSRVVETTLLSSEMLKRSSNPALGRLAAAVQRRDAEQRVENYSRMHHRHARS